MGSSKSCNGSKWVEMSLNGFKLSEMCPDIPKWVRNGIRLPEMAPDFVFSEMRQKLKRNGQITRNGSGIDQIWIHDQIKIIQNHGGQDPLFFLLK